MQLLVSGNVLCREEKKSLTQWVRRCIPCFTPEIVFEKWAAVEVANRNGVPNEMQLYALRGGHFAVFDHYGPPSEFPKTLNFIFSQWLLQSEWQLDDREHFEMLLPGWRADDLNAREEVWIPVKKL